MSGIGGYVNVNNPERGALSSVPINFGNDVAHVAKTIGKTIGNAFRNFFH